ncbi:butyrophilin-like protein 3 [Oryzias latipes]|uniref:Uncharacterized protein n=1 Tax=Oryzias latipes TaxID=8090 RepID=A0A3B3HF47_ORYLA|nr:butyrophilin-like protein 3 [Oryzias latipes]
MDRRIFYWIVLVLVASCCSSAPVSETFAVSVGDPKSVQRGQTVLMPCWLNPSQNAENLEIRWYREENFDTPAILKMPGKAGVLSMEASFIGRVSFHAKDATSGGLKMGDVSFQLTNVTIKDEGKYTCYVSGLQEHDSGSMHLYVTETGSLPVLSAVWQKDNSVNVSCESEGWFPQPELRWSEDQTNNRATFVRDSSGLVRVHSWIVVNASSEVSCSVGLPNTKAVVVRLRLDGNIASAPEDSGSSNGGWIAFTILLIIIMMALLGFMLYKKKGKKSADCNEENEPLLSKEVSPLTDLSSASQNYVNIKLEKTNELLLIKELEDKQGVVLRDNREKPLPDGVPHFTAITGTPGFSHGKHYWEVSLKIPNVPVKLSWWIGVTSSPEIPQREDFSPNTSNGFWFLSSSPEDKDHIQFSTVPQVRLPVHSRPQTVGVFLDYDQGELSFYDVDCKCIIGSLTAEFRGQVFPLFNPGKGETAPMRILQRTEQSQNVDPGPDRDAPPPTGEERPPAEAADHAEPTAETLAAAPPEGNEASLGSTERSLVAGADHLKPSVEPSETLAAAPPGELKASPGSTEGSKAASAKLCADHPGENCDCEDLELQLHILAKKFESNLQI